MKNLNEMRDKYSAKLDRCGPGDGAVGYLIEQVLDDIEAIIEKQDGHNTDLRTLLGIEYQRGYKAALDTVGKRLTGLPINIERRTMP